MEFHMKRHVVLVGILLLFTASLSIAQVALVRKSIIRPEQAHRLINPWTGEYAQNTHTGETLIMWYEYESNPTCQLCAKVNTTLVARIVDGQGKTVGKEFTIAAKPQEDKDVFNCCYNNKVAYNPVTDEYLVNHSEGHPDSIEYKILTQRLTADGKLKGPQVNLTGQFPSRAPFDNKPIILKFNPWTHGYLQFSQRHAEPADTTTVGFYDPITAKGTAAGPPVQTNWWVPDDYTFLPSGRLLMSTTWDVDGGVNYLITTADPSNPNEMQNQNPATWAFLGRFIPPSQAGGPILESPSPDSPVVYFSDDTNVKGQRMKADGKLDGASFSALNPPANNSRLLVSTVAFSTTSRGTVGLLIALDDDGFPNGTVSVWAQALDKNGKPVGSSKKLFSTATRERYEANKVFALPGNPGDTVARFVWYGLKIDTSTNKALGSNSVVQKFDLSVRLP